MIAAIVLTAVLSLAQIVDDRNLFEVLQDDLITAMVHARLTSAQRSTLDRCALTLVKAAARQRSRKAFDKSEVKQALRDIATAGDVFPAEDRKILAEDAKAVELGVEGKIALDGPRRAPGAVY